MNVKCTHTLYIDVCSTNIGYYWVCGFVMSHIYNACDIMIRVEFIFSGYCWNNISDFVHRLPV
jgi:hypothetical protein